MAHVQPSMVDVCIVGAGAAGFATGIFAAEGAALAGLPLQVAILDGAKSVGAKILVSGGGRCNVTHDEVSPNDFFGNRRIFREGHHCMVCFNGGRTQMRRNRQALSRD
ncbi:exported hypothetical protein [Nitrospira lenta]|uniref:RsdA/BaiN/AoA(So)-like Rossmann fold-like domain-containing protein n=1 Tax=Nitrospira lenta TaxID=1436998 RepID=A0A330LC95_9BACT|nr:exported hypothetical protein [Nitrospira lenta]